MRAAASERLNVINDSAEVVEQRRPISPPAEVVIGELAHMAALARQKFKELQRWREYDRPMAPAAEPPITPKDADLELVGKR